MPAKRDETPRRRVLTGIGLAAAAVLLLASCGGEDAGTVTDPDASMAPADSKAPADSMDETPSAMATDDDEMDDESADADESADELAAGVYRAYTEEALAEPGYETNIIFFHASWCPECRAFEESIEAGPIPDGVQILKVDYDTEAELKDKYGVNIQTTFVKVDEDGEMISLWVGYEKDRSIDNLLGQLEG
jgi:thiol-disulfide isomerase/thioredoxin